MKMGIIGCGLIGQKRAQAGAALGFELAAAADLDPRKAELLRAAHGGRAGVDHRIVLDSEADLVVVAVTHDRLAGLALEAVRAGKHVLVEKPGGLRGTELAPVAEEARLKGLRVKVGYNHRFHPSMLKARRLVDEGALGPLMYVRGRYGHGGRVGYEREWRMDPAVGGGELLDQGSHLIDLAGWFLGGFETVSGRLANYFWPAEVEDNAFMLLGTGDGRCAMLHASWTEWRNMFSFEIAGRDGKLAVDGLGGSYGVERLTYYRMLPGMGPPETTIWEFPFPDRSWELEMAELAAAIGEGREPVGGLGEAIGVLEVVERLRDAAPVAACH
jgi:predicted dehydrogenase